MHTCCFSSPGPHRCSESPAEHPDDMMTKEEACFLPAPLSQSNTQPLTRPGGRREQGREGGRGNEGRVKGEVEKALLKKYRDVDCPESLLGRETHTGWWCGGGGGIVDQIAHMMGKTS